MTSERTPQDVLRELRVAVIAAADRWARAPGLMGDILHLIDKAIAEAPDSPSNYRVRVRTPDDYDAEGKARRWTAWGIQPVGRAYSYHTIGVAVEVDFEPAKSGDTGRYSPPDADPVPHDYSFLEEEAAAPDTLSEKPGLPEIVEAVWPLVAFAEQFVLQAGPLGDDIDRLRKLIDPFLPTADDVRGILATDLSGSTDSEGR